MKKEGTGYPPELLRGNTDILLLSLIDELGTAYGYQLIKNIEQRSRGYLRFHEGTVYPVLRKLERDGFVSGEWQGAAGSQRRRYYRLTPGGLKLLKERRSIWRNFSNAMNLVLKPI